MHFISIPDNFADLSQGLVYRMDAEAEGRSIDVIVRDIATGRQVATSRFFDTRIMEIDIAPYVMRMFDPQPADKVPGLNLPQGRTVDITVQADGLSSVARRYSMLRPQRPQFITTMPANRALSRGQHDEIALFAPDGGVLKIVDDSDDSQAVIASLDIPAGEQPFVFTLTADAIAKDDCGMADIKLVLETAGAHDEIFYLVTDIDEKADGCRLAWLSSQGSIERYTFPVRLENRRTVKKKRWYAGDGYGSHTILDERSVMLLSHFEPAAVVEALGEIIASEAVWLEKDGHNIPVDVVTSEHRIEHGAAPNSLMLEIRAARREVAL